MLVCYANWLRESRKIFHKQSASLLFVIILIVFIFDAQKIKLVQMQNDFFLLFTR